MLKLFFAPDLFFRLRRLDRMPAAWFSRRQHSGFRSQRSGRSRMLAGTQRRPARIVPATGISTTAASVSARSSGATGLSGTGHRPWRLRTARHCRTRRTQRCARTCPHRRLLLTSLRLCNPLGELWIRRNHRPASLRLGRTKALTATLQWRTVLLWRPGHRRRTRSYPGASASQGLIRLWARHRHARGTASGRSWHRGRSRSCRTALLLRNNLTRPRRKRYPLRRTRSLRSRRSGPKWSSRRNLRSWHY